MLDCKKSQQGKAPNDIEFWRPMSYLSRLFLRRGFHCPFFEAATIGFSPHTRHLAAIKTRQKAAILHFHCVVARLQNQEAKKEQFLVKCPKCEKCQ